ncbi:hypothetical protein BG011_004631 [Mortierella polycephala]|uniref:Uncharacterized protein n=1 Tax=Mortierella polycephala TaxID=41804 RepID=A0A9P6PY33_9FUNG|nr:hypothetical protein BG011_004631 [Mortierella polycephala]
MWSAFKKSSNENMQVEDVIAKQKDYSVLNYLSMIESDGPSEAILTAINKTRGEDNYKNLFLPVNEADFIEEDAEDEDDDSSDYDYEDPMSISANICMQSNPIALRNRVVPREVPVEGHSDPPSSPGYSDLFEIQVPSQEMLLEFGWVTEKVSSTERNPDFLQRVHQVLENMMLVECSRLERR